MTKRPYRRMEVKKCLSCDVVITEENTYASIKGVYCKICFNEKLANRGQRTKLRAIEHMGGKCVVCGYNRFYGAMHFHHLDPSLKSKTFGSMRNWSWSRLEKELENCVLLCANCHAEVEHGGLELDASLVERIQ